MNKDTLFSILRAVATLFGAFLVGKTVFGTTIDAQVWQGIVGGVIFVLSVIWGMFDKTATVEMFQSALSQLVVFGGGILVIAGKIRGETLTAIIGLVPVITPLLYAWLSKKKSIAIATGTLGVADLAGVKEVAKKGATISPNIITP